MVCKFGKNWAWNIKELEFNYEATPSFISTPQGIWIKKKWVQGTTEAIQKKLFYFIEWLISELALDNFPVHIPNNALEEGNCFLDIEMLIK